MKKFKYSELLPLFSTLFFTSTALADSFGNNYVGVVTAGAGFYGVEYSSLMSANSHLRGRFQTSLNGDFNVGGGLGFNGPIVSFADLYGYAMLNVVEPNGNRHGQSYYGSTKIRTEMAFGIRSWITSQVELDYKMGQVANDHIYSIESRFHSTKELAVGFGYINDQFYNRHWRISARFHF